MSFLFAFVMLRKFSTGIGVDLLATHAFGNSQIGMTTHCGAHRAALSLTHGWFRFLSAGHLLFAAMIVRLAWCSTLGSGNRTDYGPWDALGF